MMERRTLCERISATKGTEHPFIVQMQAAFDDYEHIYFLQDLHVECGDLWSRLKYGQKHVGCHRSQSKVWLYQLVDAIEHLHKHGVRY
jgi:Protein kinase domain